MRNTYSLLLSTKKKRTPSGVRFFLVAETGLLVFVTNICDNQFCVSPRLRCPKKASGLRISSLFSTSALTAPSLHLPLAALGLVTQRATLVGLTTRRSDKACFASREKKKAIPFRMTFSFLVAEAGLEPTTSGL